MHSGSGDSIGQRVIMIERFVPSMQMDAPRRESNAKTRKVRRLSAEHRDANSCIILMYSQRPRSRSISHVGNHDHSLPGTSS